MRTLARRRRRRSSQLINNETAAASVAAKRAKCAGDECTCKESSEVVLFALNGERGGDNGVDSAGVDPRVILQRLFGEVLFRIQNSTPIFCVAPTAQREPRDGGRGHGTVGVALESSGG